MEIQFERAPVSVRDRYKLILLPSSLFFKRDKGRPRVAQPNGTPTDRQLVLILRALVFSLSWKFVSLPALEVKTNVTRRLFLEVCCSRTARCSQIEGAGSPCWQLQSFTHFPLRLFGCGWSGSLECLYYTKKWFHSLWIPPGGLMEGRFIGFVRDRRHVLVGIVWPRASFIATLAIKALCNWVTIDTKIK